MNKFTIQQAVEKLIFAVASA